LIYLDITIGEFMPRYDYKCSVCSSQIEFEKKFDEERFPVCCNQSMQRLWSATTAIFNGSGFYSTDNRK
jgi:putative FmdB family regulatory protein